MDRPADWLPISLNKLQFYSSWEQIRGTHIHWKLFLLCVLCCLVSSFIWYFNGRRRQFKKKQQQQIVNKTKQLIEWERPKQKEHTSLDTSACKCVDVLRWRCANKIINERWICMLAKRSWTPSMCRTYSFICDIRRTQFNEIAIESLSDASCLQLWTHDVFRYRLQMVRIE